MNAAGRLVHQHALSYQQVVEHLLDRRQLTLYLLAFFILFSALGTVYVTNVTRVLHASHQHLLAEEDRLFSEHGQLLLEESSWMRQGRIQEVAEAKLGMMVPDRQSVVVIHE